MDFVGIAARSLVLYASYYFVISRSRSIGAHADYVLRLCACVCVCVCVLSFYPSVCVIISCAQNISKSYERILMTFV